MIDVRQGPLTIAADPFSTAAERVALARPMTPAELEAFFTDAERDPRPAIVAWRGFTPMFGHAFYMADDGVWRHTLDDTPYLRKGARE